MKKRALRFSRTALAQLTKALKYIADENPAASLALADEIERALRRVQRLPLSGRLVPELEAADRREVLISPLRILYRVTPDEIRVLGVVHQRRLLAKPERR